MDKSHIEWTDATFNPWWGCMKVSEGCKNCYAESLDNRYHHADPHWGPNSSRKPMSENYWAQPLKWNREAGRLGIKKKVFCASMADVFEDSTDIVVLVGRMRLFALIEETPNLIWQLLTKRPENILLVCPLNWAYNKFPDNVWIGTSVENQKAAYERIPYLLKVPATVRFLSCEPLLGAVEIAPVIGKEWLKIAMNPNPDVSYGLQWVICGGESCHNARPMHPDWARGLRDQCKAASIPFFFKQWGEYVSVSEVEGPGNHYKFEDGATVRRTGKKAAGSLLDGVEHKEFPEYATPG